jgi:homoserine kinase type II
LGILTRFTNLNNEDIIAINLHHGLSILDIQPMVGGRENSSFLASTRDRKFVITVFNDKSLLYVSRLEKLLQHLARKNYPTTRIVSPGGEKNAVMVISERPVLVKEFIPGAVCIDLDHNMLSQVGEAMAELHQISPPDFLPKKHSYGIQQFSSIENGNIDRAYEQWLDERSEFLNEALNANLPRCLIHGDLFSENVIFEEQNLAAIIDFEEACHYYRVFDIGMGIVGLCADAGIINLANSQAFVRSYQQRQALEVEEINYLQLFVEYAAVATSYWRFWKYNIDDPDPDKSKLHLQMVEVAKQVNSIRSDEFRAAIF